MNINNSSAVGANVASVNKATTRSVDTKIKEADAEISKTDSVATQKPIDKAQQAQVPEKEQALKELEQEKLEQKLEEGVEEQVESAVETIRGFVQGNQRDLDFDVAKESNRVIITVRDKQTNEVIRQIPPEEAIELAERIESGDDITKSGVLLEGSA